MIALLLTIVWFAGPLLQWHYDVMDQFSRRTLLQAMSKHANQPKPEDGTPKKKFEYEAPGWSGVFPAYREELSNIANSFRTDITPWRNVVVVRLKLFVRV